MNDADKIAKLGGWSIDLASGTVLWSDITAEILGDPERGHATVEGWVAFHAPEYRGKVSAALELCATRGTGFDLVTEITSLQGERKWVRTTAQAKWDPAGTTVIGISGAFQDISDLVTIQENTEASNLRLSESLEGISDGFMSVNADWTVTFFNKSAEALMGVSKEDILGQSLWTVFPNEAESRFRDEYQAVMQTGRTRRFKELSKVTQRWLDVTAYATTSGLAITARDVTEEQARDEQLQLLDRVVESLNDIVMVTEAEQLDDPNGPKILYVNKAFERIMGYRLDEVIGKTPRILQGPETQQDELMRIGQALRKYKPVSAEVINYTKKGEPIWLELNIVPIAKDNGCVTHWVAVERDVTERKQAHERIQLSEERFRLVAAASNDLIWDVDLEKQEIWWNARLLDIFGYDPDTVPDRMTFWDRSLHPDDAVEILSQIDGFLNGPYDVWEMQYRFRKADGSYANVLDKGSIIRDTTGKAIRTVGSMVDITERLELDARLRQSQKMEAIGQLTGGVAHDFNNLLAIIMGNLELLKYEVQLDDLDRTAANELMDAGISAVLRGADLTKNMLAYSRKARLEPVDTDINRVVLETWDWMRRTIQSNVEIKTVLDETLWKTNVDQSSLQNAVVNLLLNARDALQDGGEICIETQNVTVNDDDVADWLDHIPNGQYVRLTIKDNGCGISKTQMHNIFDPFYTTKPVGKGSGLGLSMVQGFVKQSNGYIHVHSEPRKETRIELYFKAIIETRTTQTPLSDVEPITSADGDTGASKRHRILLAEDEKAVLTMLQKTVANAGYEVTIAESGDQAFNIFKDDSSFDLVVTDIVMPGALQGPDLAQACRALRADIPFIFLSGYASNSALSNADLLPEDIRLMKPISRQDLLTAISQRLSNIVET